MRNAIVQFPTCQPSRRQLSAKIGHRSAGRSRNNGGTAWWWCIAIAVLLLPMTAPSAWAQTDEIQVYDATIAEPGQVTLVLHNNYTPIGRNTPAFPGAVVPNHELNGVPEWAYGVTDWWEVGTYLPLYTVTGSGRFELDGAKLRSLFVSPHAAQRTFFYGINFELSYNARHWDVTRKAGEIRPIAGLHLGPWDLIVNPIVDTNFNGFRQLDFAPAERIAYNFSERWAGAVEHYADYGPLSHFHAVNNQSHTLWAVVDWKGEPTGIEVGIGHGFTDASPPLILKLMIEHAF